MPKRPEGHDTVSVRIRKEAERVARAAAGHAGISKPEWISRLIMKYGPPEIAEATRRMVGK